MSLALWYAFNLVQIAICLASACFGTFGTLLFNFRNYLVWPRFTDEGSVPEMRIWSILLIKSDLKWCKHLSRSLFLYISTTWWVSLLVDQWVPKGTFSQVLRLTLVDSFLQSIAAHRNHFVCRGVGSIFRLRGHQKCKPQIESRSRNLITKWKYKLEDVLKLTPPLAKTKNVLWEYILKNLTRYWV